MQLLASLLIAYTLHRAPGPQFRSRPIHAVATAVPTTPASSDSPLQTLGEIVSCEDDLVVIAPAARAEAPVGALLELGGDGAVGVIVMERCGLYFAARLQGAAPAADAPARLLATNLSVAVPADGEWAGVRDYLARPLGGTSFAPLPSAEAADAVRVFDDAVPAPLRKPISTSLHTGVVAVDALTPLGRGQSCAVFGPDELPAADGRSRLGARIIGAQAQLGTGVRTVCVVAGGEAERAAALDALAEAGALESTLVLSATTALQAVAASAAACSIAHANGDDALVVIDNLEGHLALWKESAKALSRAGVAVTPEEAGSQQRAFYSTLSERAARKKAGGSVTLLLLQPTPSLRTDASAVYTLADFEGEGYAQRVLTRVQQLLAAGVAITPAVLAKLDIPPPGSGHPQGGGDRRAAQHLEEITSLVDGHVDLREAVADGGRSPPLDPSNSLTRIGVGATSLRSVSATPAMMSVTQALRLELASASDPAGSEPALVRRAAAYEAVLHQPKAAALPLGDEVAMLLAASGGHLDALVPKMDAAALHALVHALPAHVRAVNPGLLDDVARKEFLLDDAAAELSAIIADYETGK